MKSAKLVKLSSELLLLARGRNFLSCTFLPVLSRLNYSDGVTVGWHDWMSMKRRFSSRWQRELSSASREDLLYDNLALCSPL